MGKYHFLLKDLEDLKKRILELENEITSETKETAEIDREKDEMDSGGFLACAESEMQPKRNLLKHLRIMLSNAKISRPENNFEVKLGLYVKVRIGTHNSKNTMWFYIGSSWAKNCTEKKSGKTLEEAQFIAIDSPVGRAFIGKKISEKVVIKLPSKEVVYYINNISFKN
jgi:transcription elongation GreA/GreB family factor